MIYLLSANQGEKCTLFLNYAERSDQVYNAWAFI